MYIYICIYIYLCVYIHVYEVSVCDVCVSHVSVCVTCVFFWCLRMCDWCVSL